MPNDIDTVLHWSRVFLTIASICVTAFPVLYLFSPWYRSKLGWAVMLQSVSVALAIDLSAAFQYWTITDLGTIFLINVAVLSFISVTSLFLTAVLVYYNFNLFNKEHENVARRRISG